MYGVMKKFTTVRFLVNINLLQHAAHIAGIFQQHYNAISRKIAAFDTQYFITITQIKIYPVSRKLPRQ
jgi:acetate kinase